MTQTFTSFADFFPFYVGQHSKPATRWLHLVGSLGGLALALMLIPRVGWWGVLGWPSMGYSFAWTSHFAIEKNKPASFGHPLWSMRGDWKMIGMMLMGRDGELTQMARTALALVGPEPALKV